MERLVGPPVLQLHQLDIPVEFRLPEIILRLLRHVQTNDPSNRVGNLFKPLFIIILIPAVKIQDILRDKDKLRDAELKESVGNLPLEIHDVILDGIVPFSEQLDDNVVLLIIRSKTLQYNVREPKSSHCGWI
jgi:hypothetical protein